MKTQGVKEPQRGDTFPTNEKPRTATTRHQDKCTSCCAAPAELILLLDVCTQGFISGFALITPWALQEWHATALIHYPEF